MNEVLIHDAEQLILYHSTIISAGNQVDGFYACSTNTEAVGGSIGLGPAET